MQIKNKKICTNVCTYQKKAVPLHRDLSHDADEVFRFAQSPRLEPHLLVNIRHAILGQK